MDKIILSGVHLQVHLGVPERERSAPQEVVLDVEVEFDVRKAGVSDRFEETLDYSRILATVRETLTARPYALVECLAESAAGAVLEAHPVLGVRVLVRKPGALKSRGVDWAGVEVVRRRHD